MRTTTSDEWRRQLLLGGGLVCHALLLASCSSSEGAAPPPAPVLTTLTVALAEPSIQVGRTTMASVAGRDQFGATMAVSAPTWSAAPSTVATIGSSGVATGVSPGQSTITGTVGSLSAAATLTVTPPSPVLTTLTVSLASATVTAGQATQATASGRDQFGAPIDAGLIVWSVASPAIASINTSGTVTGMGAGQTAIRASSGSIQGTTMLTVIPGPANRLILVTAAAGIVSGVPFTTQPIVSVRDAFGNAVASDDSTAVTMTAGSGATVIGTATRTAVSGQVTFTNLGIGGTVGATYTLTFTSAGLVASSQNVTTVPATFGNGTRIVGTDIPAGLFRSPNATSASCYWARLSGFGGTLAEILANDIGGGPSVVLLLGPLTRFWRYFVGDHCQQCRSCTSYSDHRADRHRLHVQPVRCLVKDRITRPMQSSPRLKLNSREDR